MHCLTGCILFNPCLAFLAVIMRCNPADVQEHCWIEYAVNTDKAFIRLELSLRHGNYCDHATHAVIQPSLLITTCYCDPAMSSLSRRIVGFCWILIDSPSLHWNIIALMRCIWTDCIVCKDEACTHYFCLCVRALLDSWYFLWRWSFNALCLGALRALRPLNGAKLNSKYCKVTCNFWRAIYSSPPTSRCSKVSLYSP